MEKPVRPADRNPGIFSQEIGREKVIEILRKKNESILIGDISDKSANTFDLFKRQVKSKAGQGYKNMLNVEFIEESDRVFEYGVTNCLWTKTFREKDAGDLGYAAICYGDFTKAKFFNPRLGLRLTRTLMRGEDCCNHRYTWRGGE